MKPTRTHLLLLVLLSLMAPAAAWAQAGTPSSDEERADRLLLGRLTRQLQRIDRETETLMDQAMTEARDGDGTAGLETKAKLLSLRDERDRVLSRMLILSMRHGWEIPALDESTVPPKTGRKAAEESVFGSIDVLVRRRFAGEARQIAALVRLPVVSIESGAP